MGWTHCFTASNWKTVGGKRVVDRQKECDAMCTWDSKDVDGKVISRHRVLKSAMVGSVYYAAVSSEREGQPTKVWAAVFLTCGRTKWDGTIWGYKDLDETMGPCECKCPASILALLTPTDSQWANEWREKCRQNIAAAADRRKNGPAPLYAPSGVTITAERQSWLITSEHYRRTRGYSAVRMTKRRWGTADYAMKVFLENYGTQEQRAEYAASGRDCPTEWKKPAA